MLFFGLNFKACNGFYFKVGAIHFKHALMLWENTGMKRMTPMQKSTPQKLKKKHLVNGEATQHKY